MNDLNTHSQFQPFYVNSNLNENYLIIITFLMHLMLDYEIHIFSLPVRIFISLMQLTKCTSIVYLVY